MQIEACKINESIVINQQIIITILEIKPSRVKLGVQTPKGIQAHRQELRKKLQKECASTKPAN